MTEVKEVAPDPLPFLFPLVEPYAQGYLDVGDGHRVWWEECGNRSGKPVVLLHGGPGAPSRPMHRRYFDPTFFRFVTMHQRGCGKSTPLAETRSNNTSALIGDIDTLRRHLGVQKWIVVGGSWGSFLTLAYGERHPDDCLGFGLSGVVLGRPGDGDWWWNGTRMIFPEAFDTLAAALPPDQREDVRAGYHRQLMSPDPAIHGPAAMALCRFSAATVNVVPNAATLDSYRDLNVALPLARLFLHYNSNNYFLPPGQLLRDLHKIRHLPCLITSGRYDVTTPVESAWALHKAWPGSAITILKDAAHGWNDESFARAILTAHETMRGW